MHSALAAPAAAAVRDEDAGPHSGRTISHDDSQFGHWNSIIQKQAHCECAQVCPSRNLKLDRGHDRSETVGALRERWCWSDFCTLNDDGLSDWN